MSEHEKRSFRSAFGDSRFSDSADKHSQRRPNASAAAISTFTLTRPCREAVVVPSVGNYHLVRGGSGWTRTGTRVQEDPGLED